MREPSATPSPAVIAFLLTPWNSWAPDLLAELGPGNSTTYFVRQPRTTREIERACIAALVCCADDLRYGGTDPKVIARLGNDPHVCDRLLVPSSPRLVLAPALWRRRGGS